MIDHFSFYIILIFWALLTIISFIVLLFVSAPYGRYQKNGWGPKCNGTIGWILMESPSCIIFACFFAVGDHLTNFYNILFFVLWELHYLNRSFIFPLRRSLTAKPIPLIIVLIAAIFNSINAGLNSYWLNILSPYYSSQWIYSFDFIAGVFLFFMGMVINLKADETLLALRCTGEKSYKIPRVGLFNYITCPNYFGEIVEWLGFAIATHSPAAFVFFLWTVANLVPRAISHHKWYYAHFSDYPKDRKIIIPFIF